MTNSLRPTNLTQQALAAWLAEYDRLKAEWRARAIELAINEWFHD